MARRFGPVFGRVRECKASDYIKDISELQPGDLVVLALRVSGWVQDHNGNLRRSEINLREVVAQRGATVLDVPRHFKRRRGHLKRHLGHHVGSGYDPYWLMPLARYAIEHGAKVLAETTDRYIRPAHYSKLNQNAQAGAIEFEDLKYCVGDAILMTHLHPDATPREVRAYQRKRGQRVSGRKGGRPIKKTAGYKKHWASQQKPKVIALRKQGLSVRKIAAATQVRPSTVGRWIQGR